ncbi:MAG: Mth938-like domain-containing protein [Anaerolineae bacterium]
MGETRQPPEIEAYRFGRIVVDGQAHTKDLIVLPDRVVTGWWRQQGHRLSVQDLDPVFQANPEVLIVGQGTFGRLTVPEETRHAVEARGIELIAQPTPRACDTYNQMRGERQVAAALHLTC